MAKFEEIKSTTGDTWEVHRAGCADVRKKIRADGVPACYIEDQIQTIETDDIENYPMQAATEMDESFGIDTASINPETGEDQYGQQSWTALGVEYYWRIMPCCRK
jgi:hypothetical protein